jgi:hypothetical protein
VRLELHKPGTGGIVETGWWIVEARCPYFPRSPDAGAGEKTPC